MHRKDTSVDHTAVRALSAETRVCVAGPGAIGVTLAARFALVDYNVTIVAGGESLKDIRSNGIRLIDGRATVGCAFLSESPQAQTLIVPVINGIPWWYFEGESARFSGRNVGSVDP
jgi:2-dehydropantoate 2-reductase